MGKKGFHFNQSLCSGCHSCMMVCKENHHLPEGAFFRRVSSFVSEEPCSMMTARASAASPA